MSVEIITYAEIKQGLKGIGRPFFSHWVYYVKNKGYLDPVTSGLIQTGKISKPIEVVEYLAKILPDDVLKNTKKIHYGDFQKSLTSNRLVNVLNEELTKEKHTSKIMDKTRRYGSFGHAMAAKLFSGDLLSNEVFVTTVQNAKQESLFSNEYGYELLQQQHGIKEKKQGKKLLGKLIDKIEKNWKELLAIMKKGSLPMQTAEYQTLLKDLRLIFDDEWMKKMYGFADLDEQYLSFLTFMTWVPILLHYKKVGSCPLFCEVSVLENSSDVGVGRIDALSVVTIGGKPPTEAQLKKIKKLTKREEPFDSIGHVIRALINVFGAHIHLKITDWKFAVGDGTQSMKKKLNLIYSSDVETKPLTKHEDQVRRYLSTSVLSHSLAAGYSKVQEVERLWETGLFSITGELVYFLPDRLPVVHEITLTQDELKSVFTEQIVSNFNSARLQATLRAASNLAITHVIQIMKNIEGVVRPAEASGTFEFGNELVEKNTPTIASIVMEYYDPKFKDVSTKCIEIVGHNGKNEVLEMHVDKLLLAIQSKDIEADLGFNVHTGGKICCPVHGEHTPSLSVAFDLGKFRCFGCGIAGHFNLASIPENIEISMGRTVRYELDKLVIPPRHKEVMSLAQDILHQSFRRSAGEVYVATERGLDPDVSYHFMDIGYGDDRLIELLLVAGCTYDELLHYGLLGLSSGKNAHMGSVVQLLKRFNMTIDTQRRMMDDERTAGLPYSILGGRITYPLEIHNCINSIYGRSIDPLCPKPLKHRKTKAKYTGMRHGGLNISLATKSNAPYIMVSEAPLNMATLIQTSDLPAQTAIVGVNNPLLVELLSGYTGSLILGMDYDKPKWSEKLKRNIGETGQRNTILFRDKVVNDYGFKGRVLDFTGAFVKNNPGIIYNDPNQYWLDYGKRISILNNLQEIPETYTHSMEDK